MTLSAIFYLATTCLALLSLLHHRFAVGDASTTVTRLMHGLELMDRLEIFANFATTTTKSKNIKSDIK